MEGKEVVIRAIKGFWKERRYQILAFFLCGFTMYLYLVYSALLQGEDATKVGGDNFAIYLSAIQQFYRDLFNGNMLGYSWNMCLGMNTSAYYTAYMGGSIFNLLFPVLGMVDGETILWIMYIVKGALTGGCFVFFAERVMKMQGPYTLMFALFYALSGTQIAIYLQNFIWMDAEYILPVLLVYLWEFLQGKEWGWTKLLCTYAYLFCCNLFMGYIVGFFSAIFFALLLWENRRKIEIFSVATKYAAAVVLAAGINAVALVPTGIFLFTKAAPDATGGDTIVLSIRAFLCSFLLGRKFEKDTVQPYLYTGVISLALFPIYWLSNGITRKEKTRNGILMAILAGSCIFPPLYLFWHGFDAPDGWYYRFSFLITFLLSVIGCRVWGEEIDKDPEKEGNKKETILRIIMMVAVLLSIMIVAGFTLPLPEGSKSIGGTAIFLLLWLGILMLRKKHGQTGGAWIAGCIILSMLEVMINGFLSYGIINSKSKLQNFEMVGEQALEELKEDSSWYRVHFINARNMNWDSYFGIPGNSDFGTLENYGVRRSLGLLGAYTSPRVLTSYGQNPVTRLITGVKYYIQGKDDYRNLEETSERVVFPYDRYLGIGFLVQGELEDFRFPGENIYENCNALASAMSGEVLTIFSPYDMERVSLVSENVSLESREGGYHISLLSEEEMGTLTFYAEDTGKPLYGTFDCGFSVSKSQGAVILKGTQEANDAGRLGVRYSIPMMKEDDHYQISLLMQSGKTLTEDTIRRIYFYECREEQVDRMYELLREHQLQVVECRNGYLQGNISVEDSSQILFTSIPYDSGWSMVSSLEGAEMISVLEGAFIGVKFSAPGEYHLKFSYEVPGKRLGIIITVLTIGILLCCLWFRTKGILKHRKDEKR